MIEDIPNFIGVVTGVEITVVGNSPHGIKADSCAFLNGECIERNECTIWANGFEALE